MSIATHVIKVKGTFDEKIWNEKKLEEYVDLKIENEINESFDTDLELYNVSGNKIEIWILLFGYPSEVKNEVIDKWINDHIVEEGLKVESFEFEKLVDITKKEWKHRPFIYIPTRFKGLKMKKTMGKLEEIKKGEMKI
jgi:hypothetical protein